MFLRFFPLENDWSLITGYNNTVRKLRFSGPSQSPTKFPPPQTTPAWHSPSLFFRVFPPSSLYRSPFLLRWDWEKGKRTLAVIWNVLIAVWTPVSLRKLNWPAVMSQYSEPSDLLHLASYQPSPRLSQAVSPGQLLTAHIWQCVQIHWGHRAIGNVCLRGQNAVLENQVITVAEKARSGDSRRATVYFVPLLFLTSVHSITLTSPLLSHWNILSQTWQPTPSSAATADIPPSSLFVSSPSSPCTLASLSPTCLELHFFDACSPSSFPHRSPMQDCKHKAHNCSLWPRDFLVIAITMLAGFLMSPLL